MKKLLVLDVDGTLTDGRIIYDNNGIEAKNFSVKDGLVLKTLPKVGISVIFMTGRHSAITEKRGREFDVQDILQGISDKKAELLSYIDSKKISIQDVAYIGDDLNDYTAMKLCGFKACPADAALEIKVICDYVAPYNGGDGAVRDICEYILKKEGIYDGFLECYGIN